MKKKQKKRHEPRRSGGPKKRTSKGEEAKGRSSSSNVKAKGGSGRSERGERPPAKGIRGQDQPLILGRSGCQVRSDGMRYQVGAAVPGDIIMMEPIRERGDPIPARLTQIVEPSPHRVQAPCSLLNRCGGCTFQAMDYAAQLNEKHRALRRALEPLCDGGLIPRRPGRSARRIR